MARFSLDVAAWFPPGTSVEVTSRVGGSRAGVGDVVWSGLVPADGRVNMNSLTEDGRYWLSGPVGGEVRAVAFRASESPGLPSAAPGRQVVAGEVSAAPAPEPELGARLRQDQVPPGTVQRSDTPFGEATPKAA